MTPLQAYQTIQQQSVLGLFEQKALRWLLERGEVTEFESGSQLSQPANPTVATFVVRGEVSLESADDPAGGDDAEAGDLLEPETVFDEKPDQWRYDWFGEGDGAILTFPRKAFWKALHQTPSLEDYLQKIARHPELQRLENDLDLLGFDGREIRKTFNLLERRSVTPEGIREELDGTMAVLHRGDVVVRTSFEGESKTVGHYRSGDYLIADELDDQVTVEFPDECVLWVLDLEDWEREIPAGKIFEVMDLVGPVDHEASRVRRTARRQQERVRDDQVVRSDAGDKEKDDDVSIGDFRTSAEERERLHNKTFRHVRQHDEMDCGAACLATIAKFYGKNIGLPQFRSLVQVTKDGASMLSLKNAAKETGMQALGAMSGIKGLRKLRPPFIALCEYHFLVVYRVGEEQVTVSDPAYNEIRDIPIDEFEEMYSQNILLLKPTDEFYEYPESEPTYQKYLTLLSDSKMMVAEALGASILAFLLGLGTPLFLQFVFDQVIAEASMQVLNALAVAMIVVHLVSAGINWTRNYLLSHLSAEFDAKFSSLFLKHAYKLPLNYFAVRRVGDFTSRLRELRKIREFMTGRTLKTVVNLLSVVMYTAVIGLYDLRLLGLLLLLLPLQVAFLGYFIPKLTRNLEKTFKAYAENQSRAYEQFDSLGSLKALGTLVPARWQWETSFLEMAELRKEFQILNGIVSTGTEVLRKATELSMLVAAVYLYLDNLLSLGQVVAVHSLVQQIVGPVVSLVNEWNEFNKVGVSFARVDDVMTAATEPDTDDSEYAGFEIDGEVQMDQVMFQYGSEMSPVVLDEVNMTIEAGETVAFVGPSGSGKSTLGYMINRLYTPKEGRVLIDEIDSAEIPLETLRRQTAMIIQDNTIFSGTILEQIALGDPHPEFREVVAAARRADAHEFISSLPEGYSTSLGEGGEGLSGGQRQRINIARALYRDPTILIMDEATSALDAASEETIVENIKDRHHQQTTVIIAHRLNTIMYADRIFVLDRGNVVERGSHDELIEAKGMYYDLFRKQM